MTTEQLNRELSFAYRVHAISCLAFCKHPTVPGQPANIAAKLVYASTRAGRNV